MARHNRFLGGPRFDDEGDGFGPNVRDRRRIQMGPGGGNQAGVAPPPADPSGFNRQNAQNRFLGALDADPFAAAAQAQEFLQGSANAFANQLMPGLERGLAATRSRFSGGSIRGGGAQQQEEFAFQRLFGNPLQDRIAQLSSQSLQFGQNEAQRGFGNANRFLDFLEGGRQFDQSLGEGRRQFDVGLAFDRENIEEERRRRRRGGFGSLLGGLAGGVGGFFLGGPAGAFAGADAGRRMGGGG